MAKKNFKNGIDEILGAPEQHKPTKNISNEENAIARTTIVTKLCQINKLKAIAFWDRKTLKDVIDDAISIYLTDYEKKNGEVKDIIQ